MLAWWWASPPDGRRAAMSSASTPRRTPAQTKAQVLEIAQQHRPARRSSARRSPTRTSYCVEDYAYPAYGVPSEETKEAIRLTARLEGMITDPVYGGKVHAGHHRPGEEGFFPKGSKVLYAHLGGAPALNGYGYAFRNG